MKHVVELKYTNPSHEHVSLRRRVETVNRVVEAQSANEALNRAANQQRALGFAIQSANIVEQTEVISEGIELEEGKVAKALAVGAMSLASMGAKAHTDTTKSVAQLAAERPALAQRLHDIGASGQVPASDKRAAELQRKQDQEMPASERRAKQLKKEEVEQVDEAAETKKDKLKKLLYRDRSNVRELGKGAGLTKTQKAAARKAIANEEFEQVDEANMRFDYEAAARPKSSDVKNFLNRDKNPRAAAASKKYIRRMTKLGGLGPNQTKKDTEAHMKSQFEEVEQVDEAKKPLKPSYWRAEWRLGTQTEVDKNNKKIYDRLAKTDPVKAAAFHDNLMRMKKKDMKEETGADKRVAGYKMPAHIKAAQAKSDTLSKVEKPVQAGTLAALKRREMKKEEVEQIDEGMMDALKKAQVKWKTAHRAAYGADPSAKSMVIGAIARAVGAKPHTARSVSTQIAGKPVTAQQQAAAKARAGKANMAKMRNEAKETADSNDVNAGVKGKKAAEKMTKKAAEVRKSKIEGSDRCWCSLINIWCPRVERHCTNFKQQTNRYKDNTN